MMSRFACRIARVADLGGAGGEGEAEQVHSLSMRVVYHMSCSTARVADLWECDAGGRVQRVVEHAEFTLSRHMSGHMSWLKAVCLTQPCN
jgi:hypothetical protein